MRIARLVLLTLTFGAASNAAGIVPLPQAASDSARPSVAPATLEELQARIRHLLDSTKTPGAALAIVRHDSVIHAGGFGLASVEPAVPATAATLFRIGSTSKAFVALAALQLQREGKLTLMDPVRQHLPDFWFENPWEATDPVRIVHLLEHTSGFDDNSLRTYAHSDPTPITLEQGLALDPSTRVSRWRPGTRFSYCNTGPAVVALVLERIEGKPFEDIVQERFFDPLGMRTATYLFPDTTRVPMASLYRRDGTTAYPYWHVFIRPAGSINASANDMAQYVRFLLGRGTIDSTVILPREDLERVERSETWVGARSGLMLGYGLHMYRTADTTGFVWTGHNGGVEGGLSDMSYIPELGIGYSLQINSGNGSAAQALGRLVRGYLTHSLPRPVEPPIGRVAPEVAREFSGWYRPVSPRQRRLYFLERLLAVERATFEDDTLRMKGLLGRTIVHLPVDDLRFRRPGESVASLAFLRDSANDRSRGIEHGNLGSSMKQVSTTVVWIEILTAAAWLAAVAVGLIGLLLVPVRALVRRVRSRPLQPSVARTLWRSAMAASALVALPVVAVAVGGADLALIGKLSIVSGTFYGAGLAFAILAIVGARLAMTRRSPTGRLQTVSLWTARAVLVLHLIAALYFMYWGPIGWQTWG